MKRWHGFALLGLLAINGQAAAPPRPPATEEEGKEHPDFALFQGRWLRTSIAMQGKEMSDDEPHTLVIFNKEMRTYDAGKLGGTWALVLRPSAKPKEIDMTDTRIKIGRVWRGIYSVKKDELIIVSSSLLRPTRLDGTENVTWREVYKRVRE